MDRLKVYVIIINFNAVEDTIECLETLLKQRYKPFQIVIVDNSTQIGTCERMTSWADGERNSLIDTAYPELVYPLSEKPITCNVVSEKTLKESMLLNDELIIVKAANNNGFAAANNIALNYIKQDNQDYLCWLLNNDTVVSKNALGEIVEFYNQNSDCHFLGTSLMEYQQRNEIQALAGLYNPRTSKLKLPKNKNDFLRSNLIKYPNGASMIIDKEFLNTIGVLSEEYFLYFEELDWTLRAKSYGYTAGFLQDKLVYHKGGVSTGKNSELADYYFLRGKLLVTIKFFKRNFLVVFILSIFAFPINRIFRGKTKRINILFKVIKDVYDWQIKNKPLKRFS